MLSEKRSFKKSTKHNHPTPTQSVIEEGHIKQYTQESNNNSIINLKIDKRIPLVKSATRKKGHSGSHSDLMMLSNVKDTIIDVVVESPDKELVEENNPTEPADDSKEEHPI